MKRLKKKILEYYYHFLKTTNYKRITIFSLETLNILLDLERYDLISQAEININIDESIISKLKEKNITLEIPYHRLYNYENNLQLLSFDSLLRLIEAKKDFTEEILKELDKFFDEKVPIKKIDFSHKWNIIFNTIKIDYEDKIINFLLKNTDKFILDLSISFYPIISVPDLVLDKLLEEGKISFISMTDKIEHYIDRIIDLIKKNPNKYKNETIIIDSIIKDHPNLLECCLENGIPFRFFKSSFNFNDDKYCSIVIKLLKDNKLNINSETFRLSSNKELLNLILETNNESLLNYLEGYSVLSLIDESNINSFCNILKNNLKIANNLFETSKDEAINIPLLLKTYLSLSKKSLSKIIDYLNHNESILDTINKESLEIIYESILENTNLNKNHINELKNKFGYHIIRYFQNENIISLINLDDLDFQKILNLFLVQEYTITDLEKAYDSIQQYKFSLTNPQVLSIFNNILTSLENNDSHYLECLDELKKVMDKKFYDYFYKIYPNFDNDFLNSNDLLLFIIDNIKYADYETSVYYKEVLHKITTYYIDRMRGEYQKNYRMYDDIKLPYDLEPASIQNSLLNSYINNLTSDLVRLMQKNGYELDFANAIVIYYSSHKISRFSKYDQKTISAHIGKMIKIAKQGLEEYLKETNETTYKFLIQSLDFENKIKRIYKIPEKNLNDIYRILSGLNIESLKRHLLDSNNIYNSLFEILKNNKLHLLPKNFLIYLGIESSNYELYYQYEDMACFINYFYKIYEKYQQIYASNKKNISDFYLNFLEIALNTSVYSGISSLNSLF